MHGTHHKPNCRFEYGWAADHMNQFHWTIRLESRFPKTWGEAKLSGASLEEVNLSGASLIGTNLSGADLARAILRGANLSMAKLSNVNLEGADLGGAFLNDAGYSGSSNASNWARDAFNTSNPPCQNSAEWMSMPARSRISTGASEPPADNKSR